MISTYKWFCQINPAKVFDITLKCYGMIHIVFLVNTKQHYVFMQHCIDDIFKYPTVFSHFLWVLVENKVYDTSRFSSEDHLQSVNKNLMLGSNHTTSQSHDFYHQA